MGPGTQNLGTLTSHGPKLHKISNVLLFRPGLKGVTVCRAILEMVRWTDFRALWLREAFKIVFLSPVGLL